MKGSRPEPTDETKNRSNSQLVVPEVARSRTQTGSLSILSASVFGSRDQVAVASHVEPSQEMVKSSTSKSLTSNISCYSRRYSRNFLLEELNFFPREEVTSGTSVARNGDNLSKRVEIETAELSPENEAELPKIFVGNDSAATFQEIEDDPVADLNHELNELNIDSFASLVGSDSIKVIKQELRQTSESMSSLGSRSSLSLSGAKHGNSQVNDFNRNLVLRKSILKKSSRKIGLNFESDRRRKTGIILPDGCFLDSKFDETSENQSQELENQEGMMGEDARIQVEREELGLAYQNLTIALLEIINFEIYGLEVISKTLHSIIQPLIQVYQHNLEIDRILRFIKLMVDKLYQNQLKIVKHVIFETVLQRDREISSEADIKVSTSNSTSNLLEKLNLVDLKDNLDRKTENEKQTRTSRNDRVKLASDRSDASSKKSSLEDISKDGDFGNFPYNIVDPSAIQSYYRFV